MKRTNLLRLLRCKAGKCLSAAGSEGRVVGKRRMQEKSKSNIELVILISIFWYLV